MGRKKPRHDVSADPGVLLINLDQSLATENAAKPKTGESLFVPLDALADFCRKRSIFGGAGLPNDFCYNHLEATHRTNYLYKKL